MHSPDHIGDFMGMARDSRGGVAAMMGLAAIPLFLVMGLAVDAARGYTAQSKLQAAIDAAGLAGGRVLRSGDPQVDARMFFDANYPADYLGSEIETFDVVTDEEAGTVTITATARIPTAFMRVVGKDEVSVSARTTIMERREGMELALALDVTGSMLSDGKLEAMKAAAHDLIDILYGDQELVDDLWVGLAPYVHNVNVGAGHADWLTGYDPAAFSPDVWGGCVEVRADSLDQTDDPPIADRFSPFLAPAAPSNDWPPIDGNKRGPNRGCAINAITPLTAAKSTIAAGIDDLVGNTSGASGTMSNIGLVWGWRLVSPEWRGLWGGDTPGELPKDYDAPNTTKTIVLLTDGHNGWSSDTAYTAYGSYGGGRLANTNYGDPNNDLNTRLVAICESVKAQGVELFTIMFQLSSSSLEPLYRNCASSPGHFFNSPTNEDLRQAFRTIGGRLTELRIAH